LIHLCHVAVLDAEPANLGVFDDPRLLDTLREGHVAMLQTPPDEQLPRGARILLREGYNGWVLHTQGPDKWRVCLDNDVMLRAKGSDVLTRVERMHLDLVDRRRDARLRVQ
jgi:hypothetical protein